MRTNYPAKDFTAVVRSALDSGASWSVTISSSWRLRWINKSIDIWPDKLHQPLAGLPGEKRAFTFCMLFMPTLMTMHSSSISVGYKMTYKKMNASCIELSYSWIESTGKNADTL